MHDPRTAFSKFKKFHFKFFFNKFKKGNAKTPLGGSDQPFVRNVKKKKKICH